MVLSHMCSMTLAISWRTLLFFSATPFYWVVLRAEFSCLIPFESQRRLTSTLSNFIPLSFLILTIWWPISTWILVHRDFKCSMVSYFSLRKHTKEYLKNHQLWPRHIFSLILVRMGLIRSIWRRSRILVVLISLLFFCEYFSFVYSSCTHHK